MEKKLLKSLLVIFALILFIGMNTTVKAVTRTTQNNGAWNDSNTWLLGGVLGIPNNSDDINILHNVTLNGDRTVSGSGKITIGDILSASAGILTVKNITNNGEILILGNGKLIFDTITNQAGGEINNFGLSSGNEIINALSGTIHNRPFGTLLLQDKLVNTGTFTNTANALLNIDNLDNIIGSFTNEGLVRCGVLTNDQGGDFTNSNRMEVRVIHNGSDETAATNGPGFITNTVGSTIIISDHMDNYSGKFNNHGLIKVENYWANYDRFRVGVTGTLLIKRNAINYASGASGIGVLKLFGIIRMGKFSVIHLDDIPPKSWDKSFVNKGNIEGNGQGGIYAKEESTYVQNDGDITTGPQEVFLCIGNPSDYDNNGTGDFTQDCCFLLKADAGKDQTFCHNVAPYAAIGGSPTASMGVRPYTYTWDPTSFLSNASGANGTANPPNQLVYTINITDINSCTASDNVTISPETTDPIANAGDDQTICPGASATLGGTPPGTCGTGGLTYNWQIVITSTIFVNITDNTNANPTVSPNATTTYRLTVTDGAGNTDVDFITIQVHSDVIANAGIDDTACGSSYTMQANLGSGQTGTWTTIGPIPPGLLGDISDPNMVINNLPDGSSVTLIWTISNGTCNDNDQVIITGGGVTQATVINTDITQCISSFPISAIGILDGNIAGGGETGEWVVVSGNESQLTFDKNNPTANISYSQADVYELKWTITDGNCTSESALKTITVKQKTILTAGTLTTCASLGGNPVISINNAGFLSGAPGTWSIGPTVNGAADGFGFSSANNVGNNGFSLTNITSLPIDIVVTWSVDQDGCTHEYNVPIRINENPVVSVAIPSETLCSTVGAALVHTLDGNQPQGGETGTWSVFSGNATITPGDENKYNAALNINTNSLPEVVEVRWEIDNGSCNKIISKTITVNENTTTVGPSITDCANLNDTPIINLSDAPALNGGETGTWTFTYASGVADSFDFADNSQTNTEFKVYNITTFPYKGKLIWTVSKAGNCDTKFEQTIAIYQLPTANPGSNDTATGTAYTMQAAALGANETGLWTIVSQNDLGITFDDLDKPDMQMSNLTGTSIVKLTWTVTNTASSCSATSAEITITGSGCGGLTVATVTEAIKTNCNQNFPYTNLLDGNAPAPGETGKWVVEPSSTAAATFTDDSNPTTLMEVSAPGVLDLAWIISDGGSCSSTATKTVTVVQTENIINLPITSCLSIGGNYSTTAEATLLHGGDPGTWSATINNGTATVGFGSPVNTASNNITINNVTAFPLEIDMTWTVDELGCTSEYTTSITINELPTVDAGTDVTNCDGGFVLQGSALGANESGLWTIESGGSPSFVGADTISNAVLTGLNVGDVVTMRWTVTNTVTSCVNFDEMVITETTTMAAVEGPALDDCGMIGADYLFDLAGDPTPTGTETGKWTYTSTSPDVMGFAGSDNIPNAQFKILNISTLPIIVDLTWTVSDVGVCDKEFTQKITIHDNIVADAGTDVTICSDTYTLQGSTPGVNETGVWTETSTVGVTLGNVNDPNMVISNLPAGQIVTMLWTVTHDITGCKSEPKVDITTQAAITAVGLPQKEVCTTIGASELIELSPSVPPLGVGESGKWTYVSSAGAANLNFSSGIDNIVNAQFNITNSSALPVVVDLTWTVKKIGECDKSYTKKIILNDTPIANPGPAQTIDCSNTDATIGTGVAQAGYSYEWKNSSNVVIGNTPTIIVSVADTYTLLVTIDASGCNSSNSVSVTNTATLPIADAGTDKTIDCSSTSVTIGTSSAALANHTYKWTTVTGNFVGVDDQINVDVDQAGTYTLFVTNTTTGCISLPVNMVVTDNTTLPTADAGTDQEINCTNPSVTIGAGTAQAGYSYEWTTTGAGNLVGATNNITATVDQAGTYTLKVTNDATTCFATDDVIVTAAIALPTADAGTDQEINCINSTVTIGTGTAQAGYSYEWTTTGTGNIVGATNNITATVDQAGTYTLKVTNNTTMCFATDGVTVTENITLPVVNPGLDQEINCSNPTVTIGTGTAQAGYSYHWVTSTGNIVGVANNITATADQPGTYTLQVTNDATTCTNSASIEVTENIAIPIANAGLDIFLCIDLSTTLAAVLPTGSTGLWEVVNGTVNIVNATLPNTEINSLLPNTTVMLKWTEDNGCGIDSKTITITTKTAPTVSDAGPAQTLCDGTTSTVLAGNTPISGSGVWTVVSGPAMFSDEFLTNSTVSGLTDGSTSVLKWTISNGTCPISESEVTIKVLEPKAVEDTVHQICDGESVQLIARGGTSYVWSPSQGLSATDIANPIASPTISTTYTVVINGGGTCGSTTKEIKVNVASIPIVTITDDATINIGESIDLLATGGVGYSWSPAEGLDNASIPNPVAKPRKTTTYVVTVSNIAGCSADASVNIEVKEDFEIFVPQMFEPNSSTNNIVKVNTIGIKNVVFKIYNRSNKEIFSTTDGSIGWDGKYNGTVQNMDSYVYVVIAETYAGTKITRKGSIQLVR